MRALRHFIIIPAVAAFAALGASTAQAEFQKLVAEAPDSVHLIDVRDPGEFKAGSFPTAINMTVDDVEEKIAELPSDKPIIFVCATGARSGEAYDIVKPEREDLEIYFLNATVEYAKNGSFTLQPPG